MSTLDVITSETLEEFKKAQTAGMTSGTGVYGIDLSDLISLVPVNSPFLDMLPRKAPTEGAQYAQWRALVNVNNTQPDPATAFDYAAPLVNLNEMDVSAKYGKVGAGYTVTNDAMDFAKGYADAKAIAIFNALNQWKIGIDKKAIGGQQFPLNLPTGLAVVPASTGGSIGATTAVPVQVAARTASNFFYGGSTAATATVSATTGAGTTNSATATCTAVRGAVAYDWYVNGFYYTTTTVNKVLITAIPVANQATPNIPDLYGTAPTSVPAVDTSAKAADFNGLLATLTGDYATGGAIGLVKAGTGVASGCQVTSLDGGQLTISGANVVELDTLLTQIFNSVRLSPTAFMMSSQEATTLSGAILGSNASTTFLQPNGFSERADIIAGGFVGWYMNKAAGGVPVKIEVHPHVPPGTVIARTDRVPFPNSNITNVLELRELRPVSDYEYASARVAGVSGGGPREDGETYNLSTLVNRAPVAMGILQNVGYTPI
jgi:hypothetical protein